MKRILLLQGPPDGGSAHLCHALAGAYAEGARDASHEVRTVDVARLEFPLLRSQQAWEKEPLPNRWRARASLSRPTKAARLSPGKV